MLLAEYSYATDIEVQREEAVYEKALETAQLLKSYGDSLEKIQQVTGLPLSEIENL